VVAAAAVQQRLPAALAACGEVGGTMAVRSAGSKGVSVAAAVQQTVKVMSAGGCDKQAQAHGGRHA
jgi:hypothetical protein